MVTAKGTRRFRLLFSTCFAMILGSVPATGEPNKESVLPNLFSDQTAAAGINFTHVHPHGNSLGNGAAWFDYDKDGLLDLYITQRVGSNHLYRNIGGGAFVEVAGALGAQDAAHDGAGGASTATATVSARNSESRPPAGSSTPKSIAGRVSVAEMPSRRISVSAATRKSRSSR
ncbi:MAG: VCBS repeat-containing protein [Gammaproteobacteria bacterium]|nr:VCBS repeat-containing protein [Gammaproteobacteria bacterium]